MAEYTGSCLCGKVKYKIEGEPLRVAQCHCDDCRKATGSAFATNIFVKEANLTLLQGDTRSFEHVADSGNAMVKEFCGSCGSQLFGHGAGRPGLKSVKIGSIEDIGSILPDVEVFTSSALHYTQHLSFTEKFEKGFK
ncbi:MAG: GFA family protein [Pseudomonadota bacterium]|nr:GFA family protein [Pseudomonadota bacterium]